MRKTIATVAVLLLITLMLSVTYGQESPSAKAAAGAESLSGEERYRDENTVREERGRGGIAAVKSGAAAVVRCGARS